MSQDLTDDKSTLVKVMAWCHQATSHYQPAITWANVDLTQIYVTRPQWVNTLRPRQNGRRFADDVFKCIFLNENEWISLKISLKFAPKVPINNIPALVQIMAWRRPGDKPLSEPMIVRLPSLSLNKLMSSWPPQHRVDISLKKATLDQFTINVTCNKTIILK